MNGTRLSADISHVISSLEITQQLNTLNSFKFEVRDEYLPQGCPGQGAARPFRWLGHDLFKYGNNVTISLGYQRLFKMCEGKIQNINASFTQGLAPTFSVEGADSAYVALTTPSDVHSFKAKTDSDIVLEIAKDKAKMHAVVDRTNQVFPSKIKQGGAKYAEFISGLAHDNGFEFALSGRTLYFVAPKQERSADAALAWGRDLLSFNPQLKTDAMFTEVVVRAWDRAGRRLIEGRARAGDERRQEQGKRFGSEVARDIYGQAIRVITDRPLTSSAEAQKLALAELQKSSDGFIEGTVELVGRPDLLPGKTVELRDLGNWFSGKYYIDKVTHKIGSEGYRTTCGLKRNAV
jgi:phage protein D